MIIKRIVHVYRAYGVTGVVSAVFRRLGTFRARCYPLARDLVRNASGLEIGGASSIFARGGLLPVYPVAGRIDNCDFALQTIFGNSTGRSGAVDRDEKSTFTAGKNVGRQFVAEGSNLCMIPDESYDFVLSSHMLEHAANPLRALAEWRRVLKPNGGLIIVCPHRDGTFDHRRPVTTMAHLIADFDANMDEGDLTHVPEVLELHDVSRDAGVTDIATFRDRAMRNPEIRGLHHHVFDTRLAAHVVHKAGFELLAVEPLRPYHIVVVARKMSEQSPLAQALMDDLDNLLRKSPFATDRK